MRGSGQGGIRLPCHRLACLPGIFATTSGKLAKRRFANPLPYDIFPDDNLHGVVMLPPGDSGLLSLACDTTPDSMITWGSTWSLDGYQTPANRSDSYLGWGIRLGAR